MSFPFNDKIKSLLSKYEAKDIFNHLINELDNYHNQKVHDMVSLKRREKMKIRGDNWEVFCKLYLSKDSKYDRVWLLNEIPVEVRQYLSLSKKDQGIDLVVRVTNSALDTTTDVSKYEYIPVQCKFRAPDKHGITKRVKWNDLATYVGLCVFTGPWKSHIVMTNAPGIRYPHMERTFKKEYRFRITTLAKGTFENLSRIEWLDIIGITDTKTLDKRNVSSFVVNTPIKPKVQQVKKQVGKRVTPKKTFKIVKRLDSSTPEKVTKKTVSHINLFL